jgi:hypothetical protein
MARRGFAIGLKIADFEILLDWGFAEELFHRRGAEVAVGRGDLNATKLF